MLHILRIDISDLRLRDICTHLILRMTLVHHIHGLNLRHTWLLLVELMIALPRILFLLFLLFLLTLVGTLPDAVQTLTYATTIVLMRMLLNDTISFQHPLNWILLFKHRQRQFWLYLVIWKPL